VSCSLDDSGFDFGGFYGLRLEALSPIFGDCAVNDGSAVEAFPGIEDQEEIREAIQLHKPLALRTLHLSPPVNDAKL